MQNLLLQTFLQSTEKGPVVHCYIYHIRIISTGVDEKNIEYAWKYC